MPVTLEQRDALLRAIASGVTRVSHGENSVNYATMADLLKALALVESQLAAAGLLPTTGVGAGGFRRRTVAKYNSGLY